MVLPTLTCHCPSIRLHTRGVPQWSFRHPGRDGGHAHTYSALSTLAPVCCALSAGVYTKLHDLSQNVFHRMMCRWSDLRESSELRDKMREVFIRKKHYQNDLRWTQRKNSSLSVVSNSSSLLLGPRFVFYTVSRRMPHTWSNQNSIGKLNQSKQYKIYLILPPCPQ